MAVYHTEKSDQEIAFIEDILSNQAQFTYELNHSILSLYQENADENSDLFIEQIKNQFTKVSYVDCKVYSSMVTEQLGNNDSEQKKLFEEVCEKLEKEKWVKIDKSKMRLYRVEDEFHKELEKNGVNPTRVIKWNPYKD